MYFHCPSTDGSASTVASLFSYNIELCNSLLCTGEAAGKRATIWLKVFLLFSKTSSYPHYIHVGLLIRAAYIHTYRHTSVRPPGHFYVHRTEFKGNGFIFFKLFFLNPEKRFPSSCLQLCRRRPESSFEMT